MRFLLLGDERSVKEVAANAFRGMSRAELAEASAALLKANPELRSISNLPPGSLIRVPPKIKNPRAGADEYVDPVEGMVKNVIRQLKALEAEINTNHEEHEEKVKKYPEKIREARKNLADHPEAEAVSNKLTEYLRKTRTSNKKNRERGIDAVRKMRESVSALDN